MRIRKVNSIRKSKIHCLIEMIRKIRSQYLSKWLIIIKSSLKVKQIYGLLLSYKSIKILKQINLLNSLSLTWKKLKRIANQMVLSLLRQMKSIKMWKIVKKKSQRKVRLLQVLTRLVMRANTMKTNGVKKTKMMLDKCATWYLIVQNQVSKLILLLPKP